MARFVGPAGTLLVALAASLCTPMCGSPGAEEPPAASPLGQRPLTGPPVPYEDVGACPFEGCVYREWTANDSVTVRRDRDPDAEVAFTLVPGERVVAITGIVITTRPGRVEVHRAADLWTTEGMLHVEPGETVYLLTYRGEGHWAAWFQGRVYDDLDGSMFYGMRCESRPDRCGGTIVETPESTWWIRVRTPGGIRGWTREAEKFDDKDALA
jgi:hypothetical protein